MILFQIENGKFIDFFRCRLPQEFALSYSYGLNRTRYLGTLVGPTVTRPAQDPLDVVNLDNRPYMQTFLENVQQPTANVPLSSARLLTFFQQPPLKSFKNWFKNEKWGLKYRWDLNNKNQRSARYVFTCGTQVL